MGPSKVTWMLPADSGANEWTQSVSKCSGSLPPDTWEFDLVHMDAFRYWLAIGPATGSRLFGSIYCEMYVCANTVSSKLLEGDFFVSVVGA